MPAKENVDSFIEYFVGMKCRVPVYKDGSVGDPEVKQRFVSTKNEADLSEYKLVKKDGSEDNEKDDSDETPSMDVSGEEWM